MTALTNAYLTAIVETKYIKNVINLVCACMMRFLLVTK